MYRQQISLIILGSALFLLLIVGTVFAEEPYTEHHFIEGSDRFYCDTDGDFTTAEYTLTASYWGNIQFRILFDSDLSPTEFKYNGTFEGTIVSDISGKVLHDRQVWAVRQDLETLIAHDVHTLNLRIRSYGSVAHDVGYVRYDMNTWEVLFEAGQRILFDDPFAYDFCAALDGGLIIYLEPLSFNSTPIGKNG